MYSMDVTLDVSRLSGWLNADAFCRVERRTYHAGRGARREAGGRCGGGGGATSVQEGGPDWRVEAQEIGRAHIEHVGHVCDAGRIEAHWLVERRRFLPGRKEGI